MILVSVVEDDDDIRETLTLLLDGSEGVRCVGAYASAEEALAGLAADSPHVVLLDIGLPGRSGIESLPDIRALLPDADVVMLTIHSDEDVVFRALTAGATGYLVKDSGTDRILEAVREVHAGGAPMSSSIARKIVGSFRRASGSPLSRRETEVLAELCRGQSYRTIARTLHVSEDTVHFHIKNIYRKLQVHSKSAAVAKALKDRLV